MASLEELQVAILGLPGVVGAEVSASGDAGPPAVRIWTDESRDAEELRSEVQALVTRARRDESSPRPPHSRPVTDLSGPPGPPRRSGLGRGLESLIPGDDDERAPGHLVAIDLTTPTRLELIAIEESSSGVTVRAADTAGTVAEAKVIGGAGSVNAAIVTAVAELMGEMPAPRLASVELRDSETASVLVVTLELADSTVTAGASIVSGGMPFSLGKAAWAAVRSARER